MLRFYFQQQPEWKKIKANMILKGGKKDRIELKENWSEKFQLSRKHIVLPGARTRLCRRLTQEEQVQGRSGWAGLGGFPVGVWCPELFFCPCQAQPELSKQQNSALKPAHPSAAVGSCCSKSFTRNPFPPQSISPLSHPCPD